MTRMPRGRHDPPPGRGRKDIHMTPSPDFPMALATAVQVLALVERLNSPAAVELDHPAAPHSVKNRKFPLARLLHRHGQCL